jgi:hypothetical protein
MGGYEMAAPIEERDMPSAQYPKPIDVDGIEYMPGEDIADWALEFMDLGGEG